MSSPGFSVPLRATWRGPLWSLRILVFFHQWLFTECSRWCPCRVLGTCDPPAINSYGLSFLSGPTENTLVVPAPSKSVFWLEGNRAKASVTATLVFTSVKWCSLRQQSRTLIKYQSPTGVENRAASLFKSCLPQSEGSLRGKPGNEIPSRTTRVESRRCRPWLQRWLCSRRLCSWASVSPFLQWEPCASLRSPRDNM